MLFTPGRKAFKERRYNLLAISDSAALKLELELLS